jgi:hypothetical protein
MSMQEITDISPNAPISFLMPRVVVKMNGPTWVVHVLPEVGFFVFISRDPTMAVLLMSHFMRMSLLLVV